MGAFEIFTRRRMGLDRKVWGIMLICCIVCIALLGYKSIVKEPCKIVDFTAVGINGSQKEYFVNERIHFSVLANSGGEVKWDFGDNSFSETSSMSIYHVYKKPGPFVVKATLNGNCTELTTVNIIKADPIKDFSSGQSVGISNPILPSNRYPFTGEPVSFTSNIDATVYEWWIEGSKDAPKKTKLATFTFVTPQTFVVNLKLDNDARKTYSMPLLVVAAPAPNNTAKQPANIPKILVPDYVPPYMPPSPTGGNSAQPSSPVTQPDPGPIVKPTPPPIVNNNEPEKPPRKYLYKTQDQIKFMLEDVVNGDKNVTDFDDYLCDGAQTIVTENNKQMTFIELCRLLANSGIEIKSVQFIYIKTYDDKDKTRCIKELKVIDEKPKSGWPFKRKSE